MSPYEGSFAPTSMSFWAMSHLTYTVIQIVFLVDHVREDQARSLRTLTEDFLTPTDQLVRYED